MRCGRTPPKETKVCPVCDETIVADAKTCPSCLTDLTLFDVSEAPSESAGMHASEGKSIDEILASIMEGRSDRPEIFETLKSVATSRPASEDLVVETRPPKVVEPEAETEEITEQFQCPVCETPVRPEDTVCPGCGAEFSEGEATEYECPVCKAIVPADASRCPSCGVEFAAEGEEVGPPAVEEAPGPSAPTEPARIREPEAPRPPAFLAAKPAVSAPPSAVSPRGTLRSRIDSLLEERRSKRAELPVGDMKLMARELPRLVNEVKPLLMSAKRIGLDIEAGKRLINDAVQAGKRRDIERAVRLIADARQSLDVAFLSFIGGQLGAFVADVERAQGASPSTVDAQLEEIYARLRAANYDAAWDSLRTALQGFKSQAKEYSEARGILDADAKILVEVRNLGMDVREVDRLAKQSRDALDRRDADGAARFAKQARDRLRKDVPAFIEDQMKKARDTLLDIKVRGGDVSKPVGVLKEASGCTKAGDWQAALRFLKEFYKEVGRGKNA